MESLLFQSTCATYLAPKLPKLTTGNRNPWPSSARKSVIIRAKKSNKKKSNNKEDSDSFIFRPEESDVFFPEAVLLREKKVQEDGRVLPEFADAEEQELFESLDLQLQSQLNVERMRHYEVVYLIHEKHDEEVQIVNEKVQDFIREKKGRIWRLNDWGLRRLAYKIQKAKKAHYMLMNFELEARWINDFKSMLDKDERVIRHLVIKRDEAITEDCPPPPEFHTLRSGMDDYDEEEEDGVDYDDEDFDESWDGEGEGEEIEGYDGDDVIEDGDGFKVVHIDDDLDDDEEQDPKSAGVGSTGRRNRRGEKVAR